jgi:hypothetical protein
MKQFNKIAIVAAWISLAVLVLSVLAAASAVWGS